MRRFAPCVAVFGAALVVLQSGPASAQAPPGGGEPPVRPPSAADQAAAQVLFDQGMKLMEERRFTDACPKFVESLRLDPGIGTQFNLADCYENVGQTASAWTNFLEVAGAAVGASQPERAKVARSRAAALEPRLSRLLIDVDPSARAPGLEVKRDGAIVSAALWGTAVPIDPGEHRVEASAPGKTTWKDTADVRGEGAVVTVRVPVLSNAPKSAALASSPSAAPRPRVPAPVVDGPDDPRPWQRPLGVVVAGVGVAGLGMGMAFGLVASARHDDSLAYCPNSENLCSAEGVRLRDEAITVAHASTAAFILGGAAVAGGGVLFFTAPSGSASGQAAVQVTAGGSGVAVSGRF
jgi:hypothetical protein